MKNKELTRRIMALAMAAALSVSVSPVVYAAERADAQTIKEDNQPAADAEESAEEAEGAAEEGTKTEYPLTITTYDYDGNEIETTYEKAPEKVSPAYITALDEILKKACETAQKHNVKLILLYHGHPVLNTDGTLSIPDDPDYITAMDTVCTDNQITWINMSDTFIQYYQETHILPYGFINTAVGVGHLNKYGHRLLGQKIYETISEAVK